MLQRLAHPQFTGDFHHAPPGAAPPDTLADGSRNILALTENFKKPFKGLESAGKGARVMFPLRTGFAGLSDYVSGTSCTVAFSSILSTTTVTASAGVFAPGDVGKAIQIAGAGPSGLQYFGTITAYISPTQVTVGTPCVTTVAAAASVFGTLIQGAGSGFGYIGNSIFYQGAGQLTVNGLDITGALASSTMKVLLRRAGSYTSPTSGPYSVGLVQPSSPDVYVNPEPGIGFTGLLDGVYSFKVAAIRAPTGARSIASTTSTVIQVSKGTAIIVFHVMQAGGTHWVVFAPQRGFGGTGLHYRLPIADALQIAESAIERTVTDAVTNATTTLTSATAAFTSADVGKLVTLSGGGSLTTTIAAYVSATEVTLHAPASWSSSGNTCVIVAYVPSAATRTVTNGVTNATTTLTSVTAAFTSADVGKQVVLSGGTTPTNLTTTIATYVSATEVTLIDNPGTTATGVSVTVVDVVGIERAIEVEYEDSDLLDEIAWIDDYPAPAGTHCGVLETVTMAGGCYSDATDDATAQDAGTCIAISLKNFPESFKPGNLLYLPEAILGMRARSKDSFMPVACRQSFHFVIYTGATDGPACSLITVWPDVGVGNAHGYCQVFGQIYAAVSTGGFARIGSNSEVETDWASPVAEAVKDWSPENTIAEHHPDKKVVVFSNGAEAYAYNYSKGGWSTVLAYSDWASGTALSAVNSRNTMRITLNQNGTAHLYNWNVGTATTICATSQWMMDPEPGRSKTVREYQEVLQADVTGTIYTAIHRNYRKTYAKDAYIASASNALHTNTACFNSADVGKYVLVRGAGAAGHPLRARIGSYISPTEVRLVSPAEDVAVSLAAAQNASTTIASASPTYLLIAQYIYPRTISRTDFQTFEPKRWRVRECYAYAVSIFMETNATDAMPLGVEIKGTVNLQQGGLTT